ncbi:hypothetical protein PS406_06595 [Pediococcus acidilactici]
MNMEEFSSTFDDLNAAQNILTGKLIQKYKQAVAENGETLKTLQFYNGFYFIGRDGNLLDTLSGGYVQVSKQSDATVYYSLEGMKLIFQGQNGLYDVNKKTLHILLLNTEFYLDLMHIVGLDGVLNAAINDAKNTIAILQRDLPDELA